MLTRRMVLAPVLAVLLAGCPFQSSVPIGDPQPGSLDAKLLGAWEWTDTNGATGEMEILPFNSAEYLVEIRETGKGGERARYRVYIVSIGGERFLNINELKGGEKAPSFLFARYSISSDGLLKLRLVGDDAVPKSLASDRKGLVRFLGQHLKGSFLDDGEPVSFRRAAPVAKQATSTERH